MKCYYDPRDTGGTGATGGTGGTGAAAHGGDSGAWQGEDSGTQAWSLPAVVLDRHDACELKPDEVPNADGWPSPASTVYRKGTLLLPADLHQQPALAAINQVLGQAGMHLVSVPEVAAIAEIADTQLSASLPRAAVLVPASVNGQVAARSSVDAWTALTALRAAAGPLGQRAGQALDPADVSRISLEHLLVGAAITGDPEVYGLGVDASIAKSYSYAGGTRTPIDIVLDPPPRQPAAGCVAEYGRRPVIAVLDSGMRAHPWLDVSARGNGGYATTADGFVQVDEDIQRIIYERAQQAAAAGDRDRRLIDSPWDTPASLDDLVGELAPYTGHGTFIAGIFRQIVPDATVLSIRIMHNDGIVYESDLLTALSLLAARVAKAQQDGDASRLVDAVSLSLGYFVESADDAAFTLSLQAVIDQLLAMGVVVTAAAGNYATSRKFYPAAFAGRSPGQNAVPLVSVGALNPNGTRAVFSDGGDWVTAWASGAALSSTFPVDLNGSRQPGIEVPDPRLTADTRESLDPDDFRGGFAIWSGTSFAAPVVAARLVSAALTVARAPADPAARLDAPGSSAATARVLRALQSLRRAD